MLPAWRILSRSRKPTIGFKSGTVSQSSRRATHSEPAAAQQRRSPLLNSSTTSSDTQVPAPLPIRRAFSLEGPLRLGDKTIRSAKTILDHLRDTDIPADFFTDYTVYKTIEHKRYWNFGSEVPCFILIPKRFYYPTPDPDELKSQTTTLWEIGVQRPNMHNYVQILSTPTADTPGASLLLHFPNRRYLFGQIGEGTQRLMVQRKESMMKMEDIFVTGDINWTSVGGLLGMILTVADVNEGAKAAVKENNKKKQAKSKAQGQDTGKSSDLSQGGMAALTVHGSIKLTHALATARNFVFRKGLPLRLDEFGKDARQEDPSMSAPDWEDGNIKVWKLPTREVNDPNSSPTSLSPLENGAGKKRNFDEMASTGKTQDVDANPEAVSPARDMGSDQMDYKWEDRRINRRESNENLERELTPKEMEEQQAVREGAVRAMFANNKRIDSLKAARLPEVQLPAAIFVRGEDGRIQPYQGPLPGDPKCPDIPVLVRSEQVLSRLDFLPRLDPKQPRTSLSYIIKCHSRRGRFNPERATALGVPRPEFKKLANKENVVGKDGMVVTPEMVLEPDVEGHGFALIDIAYKEYIDELIARPEWSNPEIMKGIDVMYWMVGDGVDRSSKVMSFLMKFPHIRHVFLSKTLGPNQINFDSAAAQTIKMNKLDPARFPLPVFSNESQTEVPSAAGLQSAIGRSGAALQLAPQVTFQDALAYKPLDTDAATGELRVDPEVLAMAEVAQQKIADPTFRAEVDKAEKGLPCRGAEVVTLGTGSALPSKYRNVSATLIRVPGVGSWMLDCGENTLGQLQRAYGTDGLKEILNDLRGIFISHLHADHHLGLVSLLHAWKRQTKGPPVSRPKLLVVANTFIINFLSEFRDIEPFGWGSLVTMSTRAANKINKVFSPSFASNSPLRQKHQDILGSFGLRSIDLCHVDHCMGSVAVSFTWLSGLKVAYSGDCRPSHVFSQMARGADLLIHECTFDDELQGDAVAKKHSTMSEALRVARDMNARRVMLTHFSQRYPKAAVLSDKARDIIADCDMSVLFAFDGMRVKLGEFRHAEQFLPAIRRLYEDDPVQRESAPPALD